VETVGGVVPRESRNHSGLALGCSLRLGRQQAQRSTSRQHTALRLFDYDKQVKSLQAAPCSGRTRGRTPPGARPATGRRGGEREGQRQYASRTAEREQATRASMLPACTPALHPASTNNIPLALVGPFAIISTALPTFHPTLSNLRLQAADNKRDQLALVVTVPIVTTRMPLGRATRLAGVRYGSSRRL